MVNEIYKKYYKLFVAIVASIVIYKNIEYAFVNNIYSQICYKIAILQELCIFLVIFCNTLFTSNNAFEFL